MTLSIVPVRICKDCNIANPACGFYQIKGRVCRKCVRQRSRNRTARLKKQPPPISVTEKQCAVCKETKAAERFQRDPSGKSGLKSCCRECITKRNRQVKLGISPEEFDAMVKRQKGLCAICGRNPKEVNAQGYIADHCHITGAFRGVLCMRCNLAVGMLDDSPTVARSLLKYVLRHQQLRLAV